MTDITIALETVREALVVAYYGKGAWAKKRRTETLAALSTIEAELTRLRTERDQAVAMRREEAQKADLFHAQCDEAVAALREIAQSRAVVNSLTSAGENPAYLSGDGMARIARAALARLSTPKEPTDA